MSLLGALNSAVSGLKVNQLAVDVTSRNVANAGTAGYTRKVVPRENMLVGNQGAGVRAIPTQRNVDAFLQEKLRTEQSRSARLDTTAQYLHQIDQMFGASDKEGSISYAVNALATTLGGLMDTPENAGVRQAALSGADDVARQLNHMTAKVQNLRSNAEQSLAASVEEVNNALKAIESLNREIANTKISGQSTADLEDRRDLHLKTVAQNLDIRTIERPDGNITVFTNSGYVLVSDRAARLEFDNRQHLSPDQQWSANADERGVGTLTLVSAGGTRVDLMTAGAPREGKIAALLELRDETLVETQNQLDELAHSLTVALADDITDLTTPDNAHTLDLSTVANGDRMVFSYQTAAGTRTVTAFFVQPDPVTGTLPSAEELRARVPDPDNAVFVNLGPTAAPTTAAARATELVSGLAALSPPVPTGAAGMIEAAAGTVRVPAGSQSLVRGMAHHSLSTDPDNGPQVNLFVDGSGLGGPQKPYSIALGNDTWSRTGYAGRIAVNLDLMNDNAKLVSYTRSDGTTTPLGDSSRPALMVERLVETRMSFSRDTALGGQTQAYSGTVLDLARAVTSYQGLQSANSNDQALAQGERTKLLEERFLGESGVNVDDEMANLIMLQSAYAACAKVVRTVDAMFDDLMALR